jgi:hypothetical protein
MVSIPHPKVAFGDLTKRLGEPGNEVLVPRSVLSRLLHLYISFWDFDETWYLTKYPDVKNAVAACEFASGRDHFRNVGYWEGRWGKQPRVDAEWYVETYSDIAQAMLDGKVTDPSDHFEKFGYAEGRLPAKPDVHTRWYAEHYMMRDPDKVDENEALRDFIQAGYRNLAFPAPPANL